MMLAKLPTNAVFIGRIHEWVSDNAMFITVATVKMSENANVGILKELLKRVRWANKRKGAFKVSRMADAGEAISSAMRERSLRDEVHNMPDKFCFHMSGLREYHQVHIAEIIVILLKKLLEQGIDCRVEDKTGVGDMLAKSKMGFMN